MLSLLFFGCQVVSCNQTITLTDKDKHAKNDQNGSYNNKYNHTQKST